MGSELENIVRVGKVTSVNANKKTARVIFESLGGLPSGELPILQNTATINVGSAFLTYGQEEKSHAHTATVGTWLPAVNQYVVCLFMPVFNGDGFIIGGLP